MKSYLTTLIALSGVRAVLGVASPVLGVASPVLGVASPVYTPIGTLQAGFIPNCERFALAAPGDTCRMTAERSGLNVGEFLKLNPQLGGIEGCPHHLQAFVWYCVKALGGKPAAAPPRVAPPPPAKTGKHKPKTDKPAAAPAPAPTPPPAPPTPTGCDERGNACRYAFKQQLARSEWVASVNNFCDGYLGAVNNAGAADLGLSGVLPTCGVPGELSNYCACWKMGAITAGPTQKGFGG